MTMQMMTGAIEVGLRVSGLVLVGLCAANFVAAKRWDYGGSLAGTKRIVRQIFFVHGAYIVGLIAALAALCLIWPQGFREPGMGRLVSGFFGLFWGSRVLVQCFYYDPEERRRNRAWDLFFLGVFTWLSVVFILAALVK